MMVDAVDAQLLQRVEAVAKTGNAEEVDRAVLEARARTVLRMTKTASKNVKEIVAVQFAGHLNRAAAPVQLAQVVHVFVVDEEGARSRRVPEQLVEGDADEIGLVGGQVEPAGGNEGSRVEKDEPLVALRLRERRGITSWKCPLWIFSIQSSGYFTPAKLSSAG